MKASTKKGSGRKDPAKKGATAKVAAAVQQNGVQPKRRVPAALFASAHHQWLKEGLKAADVAVRVALFLFSGLILSTIRHWAIWDDLDSSWVFGLNYAAAHGLRMGRDVIYTYGPLGHLA